MLEGFGYIALFLIVAILFASLLVVLPILLRLLHIVPRKPNPVKATPFECGMETIGRSWVQFNFRYYFYALVFLALDVLVVFLYPWAVQLRQLGVFSLYIVLIMVCILLVGYVYAWKKKALEWK